MKSAFVTTAESLIKLISYILAKNIIVLVIQHCCYSTISVITQVLGEKQTCQLQNPKQNDIPRRDRGALNSKTLWPLSTLNIKLQ